MAPGLVELVAAAAERYLARLHARAAAENLDAALLAHRRGGGSGAAAAAAFAAQRSLLLEREFRAALRSQVLEARGVSAWRALVAPDAGALRRGVAEVSAAWERVTSAEWSPELLRHAPLRMVVPKDTALLAFAMLQRAVADVVYARPWIVSPAYGERRGGGAADRRAFRAALAHGLVSACVDAPASTPAAVRGIVARTLARPLLARAREAPPERPPKSCTPGRPCRT